MNQVLQEGETDGVKWRVTQAYLDDTDNPRNWDYTMGIMVTWHQYRALGDIANGHELTTGAMAELCEVLKIAESDVADWRKVQKALDREKAIWLPIWAYEHGDITISTILEPSWPDKQWDCGQLGVIVVSRKRLYTRYGYKVISPKRREQVFYALKGEVKFYGHYVRGEAYDVEVLGPSGWETPVDTDDGHYWNYLGAVTAAKWFAARVALQKAKQAA